MVKLFFIGIGICILVVVGAFAAIFTPLLAGVDRNLGGPPQMPFHPPIPPSAVNQVHGWVAQITPSMWLTAVLGLLALLLVYTVGNVLARLARRWKQHRKRNAELRWQARVTAARELQATSSEDEYEAVWE